MTFWIIISCVSFLISMIGFFVKENYRKFILYVSVVLFTIVSAFRYQIGEDFSGYIALYETNDINNIKDYPEYSFQLISWILYELGFTSQGLFLFYSVAISFFLYLIIKKLFAKNLDRLIFFILWVIAPFDMGGWFSMNVIRQYLSVCIFVYGYLSWSDNRKLSILMFLVAVSIHYSTFFLLITFLFYYVRFSKRKITILVFLCLIFSFMSIKHYWINVVLSNIGIYGNYVDFVLGERDGSGVSNYAFLIMWMFFMVKFDEKNIKENLLLWFTSVSLMIRFTLDAPFVRINAFFAMFFVISIVYYLSDFSIKKRMAYVFSCVLFFVFCYLYMIQGMSGGHNLDWRESAGNINYEWNFELIR